MRRASSAVATRSKEARRRDHVHGLDRRAVRRAHGVRTVGTLAGARVGLRIGALRPLFATRVVVEIAPGVALGRRQLGGVARAVRCRIAKGRAGQNRETTSAHREPMKSGGCLLVVFFTVVNCSKIAD